MKYIFQIRALLVIFWYVSPIIAGLSSISEKPEDGDISASDYQNSSLLKSPEYTVEWKDFYYRDPNMAKKSPGEPSLGYYVPKKNPGTRIIVSKALLNKRRNRRRKNRRSKLKTKPQPVEIKSQYALNPKQHYRLPNHDKDADNLAVNVNGSIVKVVSAQFPKSDNAGNVFQGHQIEILPENFQDLTNLNHEIVSTSDSISVESDKIGHKIYINPISFEEPMSKETSNLTKNVEVKSKLEHEIKIHPDFKNKTKDLSKNDYVPENEDPAFSTTIQDRPLTSQNPSEKFKTDETITFPIDPQNSKVPASVPIISTETDSITDLFGDKISTAGELTLPKIEHENKSTVSTTSLSEDLAQGVTHLSTIRNEFIEDSITDDLQLSPDVEGSGSDSESLIISGINETLNTGDHPDSISFEGSGEADALDSMPNETASVRSGRILDIFSDRKDNSTPCTTPANSPGHCRPIRHCLIQDALNDFNIFLQYLCLNRGIFVGICCPDNPVIEVPNTELDNSTEVDVDSEVIQSSDDPFSGCGLGAKTRIVGGTISQPHEWTWMVALLRRNRFYCGGVIINNLYVLTAAHCVLGINIRDLKVRLGEYNFNAKNEHQQDMDVAEIKRHAQFVTLTFQHDIALLKLKRRIRFSKFVGSICLPSEDDFSGVNATVVGWGTVSFGGSVSPILRQVTVPVWKNEDCDRTYLLEDINESFMCAGSPESGEDACQGDSGGPLMSLNEKERWQVIGIVSWGRRCGDPTYPGVYTRITSYLDWIKTNAQ